MAPTRKKSGDAKARAHEFEFLGPYLGPAGIILGLPVVCFALVYACNAGGCLELTPALSLPGFPAGQRFWSTDALLVVLGWVAVQLALHLLLPARCAQGVQLPDGSRLVYRLNGLRSCVLSLGVLAYLSFGRGALDLGWVYDNYVPLLSASAALSLALSFYLYARSSARGRLLAAGGSSGARLYDFFIGRELNPRLGALDLKEFCELYPGLIGWIAIDLSMAYKQYTQLGHVTPAMALVCGFQALYVLDALWFEAAILTTMDITTDGFGFMLAFGDLAWVPFTYTLQARFLVDHPQALSPLAVAALLALKVTGYAFFRGANSQKDLFRRDPEDPRVAHLRTLPTTRGTRLIVSGWWGIARHVNYLGDWLMGWAWCLPTGFQSVIPYFYVAYFGVLLVHRDRRDEAACRQKYGKDWDKYCSIVRYRLIPGIY